MNIHSQRILILDFGSQYTMLIARRVRELGVYCEIHPYQVDDKFIQQFSPTGIILSGGPESALGETAPRAAATVFELGCPVLGICYGMQTMALQLGGQVAAGDKREYGYAQIEVLMENPLFAAIDDAINAEGQALLDVWMSHGDHVAEVPAGFQVLARSKTISVAAMGDLNRQLYALQFHPEVTHTPQGMRMLAHFVHDICGCGHSWTTTNIIEDAINNIKKQIGKARALVALSGGVDSAVTAALMHQAIGDKLTCIFVDTGLLRLNEAEQVMRVFHKKMGIDVICVNAKERFLSALSGVTDPEAKRKIAGHMFIKVFHDEALKLDGVKYLGQGTIYPDVIESAQAQQGAHVIKSHHNVGGLPEDLPFELVEPLRELFKDEVRKVGLELGLPAELIKRHPFPGPGLALRIIGDIKEHDLDILRRADFIFIEELRRAHLYDEVAQAFAVFLPIKSVGVQGDQRHYGYVIALRAVKSTDFMTAHWADLPHEFLAQVSDRIVREVPEVSRVVYDISSKPPATIEWE